MTLPHVARVMCFAHTSHLLLGVQIGFLALYLPLAFFGVFLGYKLAYRGLDRLERRSYLAGAWLFLCGFALAMFRACVLPGFGYWLAFEGGAARILGYRSAYSAAQQFPAPTRHSSTARRNMPCLPHARA